MSADRRDGAAANAAGLIVGTGDFVHAVFSHVALGSRDRVYLYRRKDPMDICVDRPGVVSVTKPIPHITMCAPDGIVLRGRPVARGARGVWGGSRGALDLAGMGLAQVTKPVRRQPAP